jgi:hypothetical protein
MRAFSNHSISLALIVLLYLLLCAFTFNYVEEDTYIYFHFAANIVEGYGRRRYKADFVKFLIYAHSSCDETLEWLKYIQDCYPELNEKTNPYIEQTKMLGRKLNNFIQAVEKQHLTPKS